MKLATTTLRMEVGIPLSSPPILSISASPNENPTVPTELYRRTPPRAPAHGPLTPRWGQATLSRLENEKGADMKSTMEHIFDLEQPRTERMPIHPAHKQAGYSYLLHRHHEDEYRPDEAGPRTGAAGVIICGEHTGTHIDALCHQSDALVLYGGVSVNSEIQS